MPKLPQSGVPGLIKKHTSLDCHRPEDLQDCACAWFGKRGKETVHLAKWSGNPVDPHSRKAAKVVLNRLFNAMDEKTYDPRGERPQLGTDASFASYILEWETHYAGKHELRSNSRESVLGVISDGLGKYALKDLADGEAIIVEWLDDQKKERKWSSNTWCRYFEQLSTLFNVGKNWTVGKVKVPRVTRNPMEFIEKLTGTKKKFDDRPLVEDIEDRLFEVVLKLNRVQHESTRGRLTQEKADEIRTRVLKGELGTVVAREFKVSPATVSGIMKGEIWNPAKYKVGTKGTEMERRLIAAFDGGPRASEMLDIQIKHVDWRLMKIQREDGTVRKIYRIVLPSSITKGGATSGELEYLYAGTDRFRLMLERRRTQLKNDPEAYLFGTEDGRHQKGFRRMWTELFTLAGLKWGRDKGLVWHTIRHEYVSRLLENERDPILVKKLARHKRLETTELYSHSRDERVLAAAAGLDRGRR